VSDPTLRTLAHRLQLRTELLQEAVRTFESLSETKLPHFQRLLIERLLDEIKKEIGE
jgi:hypothetical protein